MFHSLCIASSGCYCYVLIPEVEIFIVVYRPLVSARSERRKDNAIGSAVTNEIPRKCGLTHQARVQLCDAPVGICDRRV